MQSDLTTIVQEIKDVASAIVKKDITTIKGFSERQAKGLATQTLIIQKGVLNGEIDDDLKEFFYNGLRDMTRNFVNTLKGLLIVTIEKLINAIVNALWKFIDSV